MKSLDMKQIASIAAASLLVANIGVAASLQASPAPRNLDFDAIIAEADAASVDYFLKIDGIEGESRDSRHKDTIEILSWSWGESSTGATQRAAAGEGGGAGKVQMRDFSFSALMSKASPELFEACATGQHFKEAILVASKAGDPRREAYLTIKLTDVLVTSYQTSGNTGDGGIPTDTFTLSFQKIEFEYRPQKADGSLDAPVKAGYDLKRNEKV